MLICKGCCKIEIINGLLQFLSTPLSHLHRSVMPCAYGAVFCYTSHQWCSARYFWISRWSSPPFTAPYGAWSASPRAQVALANPSWPFV